LIPTMTVDVYDHAGRLIEQANPDRVKRLLAAPNTLTVRKRKTGKVVQIILKEHGDDSIRPSRQGDPRKYFHKHETDENPPNVLALKRLPDFTAPIFRAAVDDCIRYLHPLEVESYEEMKKAA
jgi:hypothetical protein